MKGKKCNKCSQIKSLDGFYYRKDRASHISICNKCLSKHNKQRYKKKVLSKTEKRLAEYERALSRHKTYEPQLAPYGVECRAAGDKLEVRCWYNGCGEWFIPTKYQVRNKIASLKGQSRGECNIYCSTDCKEKCSTFGRHTYPKRQARTHQAELRSILISERGTICESCGIDVPTGIICHHILPVKTNPLESLDKDNCLLLCYECDQTAHQKDGCKTGQLAYC